MMQQFLRQDTTIPSKVRPAQSEVEGQGPRKRQPRIRCPHCSWQPDGKPYWQCERCFSAFDTFMTRAHCPNRTCGNSWSHTQCIRCGILSPHEHWYANGE
jgi:hypothetical protein